MCAYGKGGTTKPAGNYRTTSRLVVAFACALQQLDQSWRDIFWAKRSSSELSFPILSVMYPQFIPVSIGTKGNLYSLTYICALHSLGVILAYEVCTMIVRKIFITFSCICTVSRTFVSIMLLEWAVM